MTISATVMLANRYGSAQHSRVERIGNLPDASIFKGKVRVDGLCSAGCEKESHSVICNSLRVGDTGKRSSLSFWRVSGLALERNPRTLNPLATIESGNVRLFIM